MSSTSKKVLVSGSNGQLGREIARQLSQDFDLILTDVENLDITNKLKVHKVLKVKSPDIIIHGAAYTRVDEAETNIDLCRKINAIGTQNMAEAAKNIGATLIYISTDYVFDGKKDKPYLETDQPHPLSVYGQTKLEGEEFVNKICDKFYIIRTAWLYGSGKNFVETMLRLVKEKKSLNIVADQIGSPTYTKDLVEVIRKIIDVKPDYGIYNFSGMGEASWYDFAREIMQQKDIDIQINPITTREYPQAAKRPAYSYLSKKKIEKALKIKTSSWQVMLEDYLNTNN